MNTALQITLGAAGIGLLGYAAAALAITRASTDPTRPTTVIELRQYTLRLAQRDVLIDLFEREFIESQETLGMQIVGTFRDLDRPDRFVWIRGFRDMTMRPTALKIFYEGPVWRAHREAANATMIDSDNVLLLRAAHAGSELSADVGARAPKGASKPSPGLVVATIYYFERPVRREFVDFFEREVRPALESAGCGARASYLTETAPNNFPRLAVREHDHAFVWFSVFPGAAQYEDSLSRLATRPEWKTLASRLRQQLKADPEVLRLAPTPRSALHG